MAFACHTRATWLQMNQCGLHALLGAGGAIPRCQILGHTHGHGYDPGPGINPVTVQLQLYVFGEPGPGPFNQAMQQLAIAMPGGYVVQTQMNAVPQAVSVSMLWQHCICCFAFDC